MGGNIGIVEKNMETTMLYYFVYCGYKSHDSNTSNNSNSNSNSKHNNNNTNKNNNRNDGNHTNNNNLMGYILEYGAGHEPGAMRLS